MNNSERFSSAVWNFHTFDSDFELAASETAGDSIAMSEIADAVEKLFEKTSEWIACLASPDVAAKFYSAMREATRDPFENPETWREMILWKWGSKAFDNFESLKVYGDAGTSSDGTVSTVMEDAERYLELGFKFLSIFPPSWLADEDKSRSLHHVRAAFAKARARFRLDVGMTLNLTDLALLGGVTPKSVSNATQQRHGKKRLIATKEGLVEAENARVWLVDRRGFVPTPGKEVPGNPTKTRGAELKDFVFVPVGQDGSPFLPDCSTANGVTDLLYQIAIDGTWDYVCTYLEALELLTTHQDVAWRGENGEALRPSGQWQRFSAMQLRQQEIAIRESIRVRFEADCAALEEMRLEFLAEKQSTTPEG